MSTVYEPRPHPGPWSEHRARIGLRWTLPFHWFEWFSRLLAYYLSHWSLLEVLEYLGRFTVLVAVIVYFMEAPDRRKQKHYQAWQVINTAQGQTGSGGRVEALEELHEDGVALVALNVRDAYLQGLRLPREDLHRSHMENADLRNSVFHDANLEDGRLNSANFRSADLRRVNFSGAVLAGCDLTAADLEAADLGGVDLSDADLSGANLLNIKWQSIKKISDATLSDVRNAPTGFLAWAAANGATGAASAGQTTSPSTSPAP